MTGDKIANTSDEGSPGNHASKWWLSGRREWMRSWGKGEGGGRVVLGWEEKAIGISRRHPSPLYINEDFPALIRTVLAWLVLPNHLASLTSCIIWLVVNTSNSKTYNKIKTVSFRLFSKLIVLEKVLSDSRHPPSKVHRVPGQSLPWHSFILSLQTTALREALPPHFFLSIASTNISTQKWQLMSCVCKTGEWVMTFSKHF